MATDLSQDSVLQYLRSGGGSVKNADLLLHFRGFIRDHADRDRNRDLFKKYVNSVATVQQLDGVSYVVLRRRFKGISAGGGGGGSAGPQRPTSGGRREPSPGKARVSPAAGADKPRPREVTTSAQQGVNAMKTILPVAGIMLNNNNNVETNFNLIQQPGVYGRPAEAQTPGLPQASAPQQSSIIRQNGMGFYPPAPGMTPAVRYGENRQLIPVQEPLRGREMERTRFTEPPVQDWNIKMRNSEVGFVPPSSSVTPVVSVNRHYEETRQQIPVQEPLRGREAELNYPNFSQPPARDWNTEMRQNQVAFIPPHPATAPVVSETRQPIRVQEPLRGREAEVRMSRFSEPPVQDWNNKMRNSEVGFVPPPSVTPVVSVNRHFEETRQQIPVQEPLRGREAEPKYPNSSEPPARNWNTEMGTHQVGFVPPPSATTPVVSVVQQQGEFRQQIPVQEPLRGREAEVKMPRFSEPPLQDRNTKMGTHQVGFVPPPSATTPAVSAVRQQGEFRQQIPVQEPLRGREAELRPPSLSVLPEPDQRLKDQVPSIRHQEDTNKEPDPPREREASLQTERGLHQEPPPPQVSLKAQVAPRRHRHRKSYKSAVSYDEDESEEEEEEEEVVPIRRGSAGGEWPFSSPLGTMGKAISASSPCIIDVPSVDPSSSSKKGLPKIYVQDVEEEEKLPPRSGPGWGLESGAEKRGQWVGTGSEPGSVRHSLPLEAEHNVQPPQQAPSKDRRYSQPAGVHLEQGSSLQQSQRESLSSSTSNLYSPSSDSGFSVREVSISGSSRGLGWNSSLEDLQTKTGNAGGGAQIQEVLVRAQKTRAEPSVFHAGSKTQTPWYHSTDHLLDNQEPMTHLSPLHHSSDHLHVDPQYAVKPWHLSTGDLLDDHHEELSEASSSSPKLRPRSGIPRRLSSHLRSRMCRSMGADLDQLLQEEERGGSEAARLNRLHLLSSSLSLRYDVSSSSLSSCSTPTRSHSLASLAEAVEGTEGGKRLPSSSASPPEGSGRQSQVPLESREHEWLVKGAAGTWPDIYSLFREDSTLLNKRDFISGFTVLHWIAKHGDHRVLNTLWYGVQKAGLSFDVNARSTCGHTPLHIAAIHGHKNIMRLLVSKFKANLKLRDTAGKKPWQYLSHTTSPEIFQLLGAPPRAALGGEGGGVVRSESTWKPEKQQQRRRRRHHLSSASSAMRPASISAKVKRSSSIAAFLKHKSLLHFHGHQSDSSL